MIGLWEKLFNIDKELLHFSYKNMQSVMGVLYVKKEALNTVQRFLLSFTWPAVAKSWPQCENLMHQIGPRWGDDSCWAKVIPSKSNGPDLCAWILLKPMMPRPSLELGGGTPSDDMISVARRPNFLSTSLSLGGTTATEEIVLVDKSRNGIHAHNFGIKHWLRDFMRTTICLKF